LLHPLKKPSSYEIRSTKLETNSNVQKKQIRNI
jgi:hypothetical protein